MILPALSTRIEVLKWRCRFVLDGELGVAEIEADCEPCRFLEEDLGLWSRHFALEPGVELDLVVDHPAREEAGQRQLGKDDHIGAARLRLAHHGEEPGDRGCAGFGAGDRPHLRRGKRDAIGHCPCLPMGRLIVDKLSRW